MNTRVIKTINIVLAVAVIFFAALSLKGVLVTKYISVQPFGTAIEDSALLPGGGRGEAGRAFADYAPIVSSGLFAPPSTLKALGRRSGTAMKRSSTARMMDSLESVKLIGTIAAQLPTEGYALFKDTKSNKQDIFKVGEDVFNVGRLKEVQVSNVTIVQSGTAYVVRMPETPEFVEEVTSSRRVRRGRALPSAP